MMNRVSIIIPVYNSESYLTKCLYTVVYQTYTNLEILIINDGSTDTSAQIIDEYASKDSRIIAIHKENGGIGSAYKAAFEVMTGDYVLFVDSDDWLELNAVENLVKLAVENDADMVSFGLNPVTPDGSIVKSGYFDNLDLVLNTNEEIIKIQFEVLKHPTLVRLYKKCLFNNITIFEQNIGIDEMLTPQLIAKCNKAVYSSKNYYNVFLRNESVSRSLFDERKIRETIKVHNFVCSFLETHIKDYLIIAYAKYLQVLTGVIHSLLRNKVRIDPLLNTELRYHMRICYQKLNEMQALRYEPITFRIRVALILYMEPIYVFVIRLSKFKDL